MIAPLVSILVFLLTLHLFKTTPFTATPPNPTRKSFYIPSSHLLLLPDVFPAGCPKGQRLCVEQKKKKTDDQKNSFSFFVFK
jgi:hypothetical protein